jgi:hypothetical protein
MTNSLNPVAIGIEDDMGPENRSKPIRSKMIPPLHASCRKSADEQRCDGAHIASQIWPMLSEAMAGDHFVDPPGSHQPVLNCRHDRPQDSVASRLFDPDCGGVRERATIAQKLQ